MTKLLQPFVSQFDGKSTLTTTEFIQIFEKYDKNGKIIMIWKITSENTGKRLWCNLFILMYQNWTPLQMFYWDLFSRAVTLKNSPGKLPLLIFLSRKEACPMKSTSSTKSLSSFNYRRNIHVVLGLSLIIFKNLCLLVIINVVVSWWLFVVFPTLFKDVRLWGSNFILKSIRHKCSSGIF